MSTMADEPITAEMVERDSDGSSCEDRDVRKRICGEADTSGPKKRRKQTTPVRFSSSLMTGMLDESNEDETEDIDSEGKPAVGSPSHASAKDENLNNEFRCQYCAQFFDDKDALDFHLRDEHNATRVPQQLQNRPIVPSVKLEPSQGTEQSESPVNLLSVKNFATSWLAGSQHVQSQAQIQSQTQLQPQND